MLHKDFFQERADSREFFGICGSFGQLRGQLTQQGQSLVCQTPDCSMTCCYEQDAYGVFTRQDTFRNLSDHTLTVTSLKSRFVFEGGEYQVYTQFNNWQTENAGQWQELTTGIRIACESMRSCQNATPFLALWSCQEQRGVAFHLLPIGSWEMKVTRIGIRGKKTKILVELGLSDCNLSVPVAPGESLSLPELLCYEFKNKVDMDAYKLHNYMHTRYPRRELPVIYNTWMYRFDHISYENISRQIPLAADIGCEYFFIDAGWFGKGGDWSTSVGDWEENTVSGFRGRMLDIANEVRAAGMQFGVWMEPERANVHSDSVKNHPSYYLPQGADQSNRFLDFANPEAREWMLGVISGLVERYGIAYIKDDFNAQEYFDVESQAFLSYHRGHTVFMQELRRRHPHLYLSSCASGGIRMELENYKLFDSSWPSDNESPYAEMEMYKHAIRRLPPQALERWAAIHSLSGTEDFYASFANCNQGECERLIACGDATWSHVVGVRASYLKGFMTCGPIGFSCDLSMVSPKMREELKAFIAWVKAQRDFWRTAVARILCDTRTVTVYQYSDMALTRVVVQLFTNDVLQNTCRVYPQVDAAKCYRVNGEQVLTGAQLLEEGLVFTLHSDWADHYPMFEMLLEAEA